MSNLSPIAGLRSRLANRTSMCATSSRGQSPIRLPYSEPWASRKRAGLHKLHQSHDLTILNVVWAPMMTIMPHNHSMWAVIGIYTGREDNIFWRRLPGSPGKVEAAGAQALCERDAALLGHDIIHSVTNPIPRLTGAIHVYGGDFFDPTHRSEWDPETLLEGPFDPERAVRRFEEANEILENRQGRQDR